MTARARRSDPDTSHEAAQRVRDDTLCWRIYNDLLDHGPGCSWEIHRSTDIAYSSLTPRMKDLRKTGYVRELAREPRKNGEGRRTKQIIWEAIP
jgi:hypothetical protein